jgi:hypothetical protein
MVQATQPVATEYPTHGAPATTTPRFFVRTMANRFSDVTAGISWHILWCGRYSSVVLYVATEDLHELVFVQQQQLIEAL